MHAQFYCIYFLLFRIATVEYSDEAAAMAVKQYLENNTLQGHRVQVHFSWLQKSLRPPRHDKLSANIGSSFKPFVPGESLGVNPSMQIPAPSHGPTRIINHFPQTKPSTFILSDNIPASAVFPPPPPPPLPPSFGRPLPPSPSLPEHYKSNREGQTVTARQIDHVFRSESSHGNIREENCKTIRHNNNIDSNMDRNHSIGDPCIRNFIYVDNNIRDSSRDCYLNESDSRQRYQEARTVGSLDDMHHSDSRADRNQVKRHENNLDRIQERSKEGRRQRSPRRRKEGSRDTKGRHRSTSPRDRTKDVEKNSAKDRIEANSCHVLENNSHHSRESSKSDMTDSNYYCKERSYSGYESKSRSSNNRLCTRSPREYFDSRRSRDF